MKELLITMYVTRMKVKYSLSVKKSQYLLSCILFAILFKVIKPGNINYYKGSIIDIKGVTFSNNKINLPDSIFNIESNYIPVPLLEKKVMSDNWDKFLDNRRKIN